MPFAAKLMTFSSLAIASIAMCVNMFLLIRDTSQKWIRKYKGSFESVQTELHEHGYRPIKAIGNVYIFKNNFLLVSGGDVLVHDKGSFCELHTPFRENNVISPKLQSE
ncbi:hypothetical protein OAP56_00250 [Rickettsiaceae bacterium]|nr:hypothetical protein [Rickettsiaceae bacterium]